MHRFISVTSNVNHPSINERSYVTDIMPINSSTITMTTLLRTNRQYLTKNKGNINKYGENG